MKSIHETMHPSRGLNRDHPLMRRTNLPLHHAIE